MFLALCAVFLLIMRSDAVRGQLCEIAPAHPVRSPVNNLKSPFDQCSLTHNRSCQLHYISMTMGSEHANCCPSLLNYPINVARVYAQLASCFNTI